MKAAFAAVLGGLQSLSCDDSRERPVDRLAALGAAGRKADREGHELRQAHLASLGVDLIALKFGQRKASHQPAEDALAEILAWPSWWTGGKVELSRHQIDLVTWWALHEWVEDRCPPRPTGCGGALIVPTAIAIEGVQPTMTCPKCGGVGKRLWSDLDREQAMGNSYPAGMDNAHRIIAHAEALATRRAMAMLERW